MSSRSRPFHTAFVSFARSWDIARNALKVGLEEWQRLGVNPFQIGFIASTDTHNGTPGFVYEDRYAGQHGTADDSISDRTQDELLNIHGMDMNPAGVAGVWAEEVTSQ